MRYFAATITILAFLALLVFPVSALAQGADTPGISPSKGLVPCGGYTYDAAGNVTGNQPECDFNYLLIMTKNIITFLFYFSTAIAAAAFAVAGFKYVTAQGNTGQITQAHSIFKNVVVGLIIALSGWLLINTILSALVEPGYTLLK